MFEPPKNGGLVGSDDFLCSIWSGFLGSICLLIFRSVTTKTLPRLWIEYYKLVISLLRPLLQRETTKSTLDHTQHFHAMLHKLKLYEVGCHQNAMKIMFSMFRCTMYLVYVVRCGLSPWYQVISLGFRAVAFYVWDMFMSNKYIWLFLNLTLPIFFSTIALTI